MFTIPRNKFLIGTTRKQVYINSPLQGREKTAMQFVNNGQLLGGTPYTVASGFSGVYSKELAWKREDKFSIDQINSIIYQKYGHGFAYYADMNVANILPTLYSNPDLQIGTDIGFNSNQDVVLIETPENTLELPVQGLRTNIPNSGYVLPFTFLVPDECGFAVGIKGSSLSTTDFTIEWGSHIINIPVNDDLTQMFDFALNRDDYPEAGRVAKLYVSGPGMLELYGLAITYSNAHCTLNEIYRNNPNKHISGQGLFGCRITSADIGIQEWGLFGDNTKKSDAFTFTSVEQSEI